MTLEELQTEHAKDVNDYWCSREKRLAILESDQRVIICHCITDNKEAQELLKRLLAEQRLAWEKAEKDEIDDLLHIQQMEKENYLKEEAQKEKLRDLLSGKTKPKDKGR